MIDRKKFLLLGSLSFISLFLPNFIFSKVSVAQPSADILNLLKTAKKYRKQNKLAKAKSIYEEVLALDPAEIRAYNGIRKILLGQKNKEYEVVKLYEQALINIPSNKRIKQRLYNEYFKAAIGNRKVLNKLNISGRPLVYVKQKYESLLLEFPEKKNLESQIAKIQKYISLGVDTQNSHQNKPLKEYRKEQRNLYKRRFGRISSQEASLRLSALTAEPFSEDRLAHEREMSKINILALRSEKRYAEASRAAYLYLTTKSATDPYFMKQFRDLSKQLHNYDELITFEQQNHSAKNSFWSAIALFDVYMRKAEHSDQSFSQLGTLIQFIAENITSPGHRFEVRTRKIKYSLLQNDLISAKSLIIEQCREKMGTVDAHSIDRINYLAARYYVKLGQWEQKSKILSIASNPDLYIQSPDELEFFLAAMNSKRSNANPLHLKNLQKNINAL